jgi:hypothetical protein
MCGPEVGRSAGVRFDEATCQARSGALLIRPTCLSKPPKSRRTDGNVNNAGSPISNRVTAHIHESSPYGRSGAEVAPPSHRFVSSSNRLLTQASTRNDRGSELPRQTIQ